ncbi:MAG: HAMP domain-containing histidine kinase [bacterium]|nr:HAMP domain-containing histidine kinase [bacterium]
MGSASVISISLGVAALCAALLNFGLHRLGLRSRDHFWLAVAALGIVQLAIGNALVYSAQTVAAAEAAQVVSLAACVPLVIGSLRFASLLVGVRILWIEIPAGFFSAAIVLTVLARPELLFTGEIVEAHIPALGLHFVESRLSPLAGLMFAPFLLVFATVIVLFWRNRRNIEQSGLLVGSAVLWLLAATNDSLVGTGFYRGPYLMVGGYVVFLLAFTFLLVRRFVDSLDAVEASSDDLKLVIEETTEKLRQKDMQVAHGARMATVGTLAAGLAQEIQLPLEDVTHRLEGAATRFGVIEEREAFEASLANARRGVDRIRTIVTRLLHVARRDTGQLGPVNVNQVIEAVLPIVGHEARGRASLETSLERLPNVDGDERLLGQIVLNLVLNALHAAPEKGAHGHQVRVSTQAVPDGVRILVSDTGPGISRDIREHVFEPFFTTKPPGEGSGLGLTVTRQIVERHGGEIDFRSTSRGTTFIVDLPASDPVVEPA